MTGAFTNTISNLLVGINFLSFSHLLLSTSFATLSAVSKDALDMFGENVLIPSPEIWLKWWADRGGNQKALFVSVYFVLAIFNSIANGGYVWYVPGIP